MIPITKWAGLVTNASQYAIPPGAAVEQVNLQCLVPGQLTVRPGMTPVTFANPSTSTTAIVRAFRYQHGSSEHIVYQDAQGNIYSSVVSAATVATVSPPASPTITSALPGNATISVTVAAPVATGGSAVTGYSFQTSVDNGATWQAAGSSTATNYTIAGLTNGSAYRIRAAAANSSGSGDYSASFGPVSPRAPTIGPASPPSFLAATPSASNTATVAWYTPTDTGGSAITGYSIQGSVDRGLAWTTLATVGVVSQHSVSGLLAGTDYVFRVAGITAYGTGQYSAASNSVTITGTTSTPSQPNNLSGVATTTSVTLSWAPPASTGGSAITGYTIRYGTSSQGPWSVLSASGLSGTVGDLSPGTRYTFGVYASNSNGGGQIASIDVTTLAEVANTVPSAPTNLSLTATADGFTATWDAPASNGGSAITAYRLTTATSPTAQETQRYQNTSRSYTATGLTAGTTVWVSVYAINAVGVSTSMRSNVTIGLPPSAPLNFTATPTNTQVSLSWAPPASLYGQPVTGYTLSYGSGYGEQVAGNITSKTMTPIAGQPFVTGATYTYTVAAVTAAGAGTPASVSFTVPAAPFIKPSAPRNLVLTPRDGGFTATWDAPEDSGSGPVLRYSMFYDPPAVWSPFFSATARTGTVTGLPNGKSVLVRLVGDTAYGFNFVEGYVTPYGTATAPQGLSYSLAYILPDRATVSLSWAAPSSLGGLALKRYVIYKDGVEYTASSVASATITQVPSTASYVVYAETAAGLSPASNAISVVVGTPSAPPPPTLTLVSSTSGQLQFTAYSASASSSMSYEGQFSLDGGATWQNATQSLSAIDGGGVKFACDIPYTGASSRSVSARARASSSYGGVSYASGWSSLPVTSVTFSAPLFAPTISSIELSGGKVRILWTAAYGTGGSPITKYTVTYSGTGVTTTTYDAGQSLQYDITRQNNNAATIVVRAYNAIGNTASSPYTLPGVVPAPAWDSVEPLLPQFVGGTGLQPHSLTSTVKMRVSHPPGIEWQTVDFYRWQYSADGVAWTTLADTPTTDDDQGRTYTATSQPTGIRYYRAMASVGGTMSPPTMAKQKPVAPGAVRSTSMTTPTYSDGVLRATVSWTGSLYDGGKPITAYEIQTAWVYGPLGLATQWSATVEHSVATYGTGPYSRSVTFPVSPEIEQSSPGLPFATYYYVRIRAATSRDFSDPIRAGAWAGPVVIQ